MYKNVPGLVGRAVPERRHMLSGLDRLLVISWLVLSSQIWVFHFSPQKSAPESQLLANTGCWYAGVMSQTDKNPQAASTACLVLAKSADPDSDRV